MANTKSAPHIRDLLSKGFCVLPKSIPSEHLEAMRQHIFEEHKALMTAFALHKGFDGPVQNLTDGFRNFRQRGEGRYEIVSDWVGEQLVKYGEDIWMPTIRTVLGADCVLIASGVFLSLPGAEHQEFHTDGPPLSYEVNLPPHVINVFVCLVDVGPKNGTEFKPGTQLVERQNESEDNAVPNHESPKIAAGGVFCFDYRVVHRGLANKTQEKRPCMYATYAKPWYRDEYNFNPVRYGRVLKPAVLKRTRNEIE